MQYFKLCILILFVACKGGNISSGLSSLNATNNLNPVGKNNPTGNSNEYCLNELAENYQAQPITGGVENCIFKLCLDSLAENYSIDKVLAAQAYLTNKNGYIVGDQTKCGNAQPKPGDTADFPSGLKGYHNYQEYVNAMTQLAKDYPQITRPVTMGKTVQGRPIFGLRISAQENLEKSQSDLPIFLVFGTHHAREHLSTEVPLRILQKILSTYQTDTNLRNLLKDRELYIFPMINPDGVTYDILNGLAFWRKNRADNGDGTFGVDLNRNYDEKWAQGGSSSNTNSEIYHGPTPFSEPETQAVRDYIESFNAGRVTSILTFHSFSELVLYPWGGTNDKVPGKDGEVFVKMAKEMAAMNGYTPMQASSLYIATGDTCDWAYAKHKIFCFTIELSPNQNGGTFYPKDTIIQTTVDKNTGPLLYMLDLADDPSRVVP